MAVQTLNTLKSWFTTGKKPTQAQFSDVFDSFFHKLDTIPMSDIEGLDTALAGAVDTTSFTNHVNDLSAHGLDGYYKLDGSRHITGSMAISSGNNGFYATVKTDNVVSDQTYQFPANGGILEVSYYKGIANGYAGLDTSGKVPTSQLPAGIVGSMQYQGKWNASTNTPALASGVGTTGYFYIVGTAGTTNIDGNNTWNVGDWIVYDGTAWDKIDNYEAVTTVFGRVGNITLLSSDVTGALTYTPVNKAGDTMTGALKLPAGTAINPSLLFSGSSTNTGIYTSGVDQISILIIGTNRVIISNTGMTISGGLAVTTGVSITGNLQFKGGSRAITDDNGNTLIGFPATVASAINYLQISNSISGSAVSITAQGSTNTSLNISTTGTGLLSFINGVGGSTQFFGQSSAGGNYLLVTLNQAVANVANRSSLKLACFNASSASIGSSLQAGLTVTTAGSETSIIEFVTRLSGTDKVRAYINGNTWSIGADTAVGTVYRTSNAGADLTPFLLIDPYDSVSSAGSNSLGYDPINTNGLFWARTNGTRRIMRASLGLTNNTDTAGSEVSDLLLTTIAGGSFSVFGNILFYNGVPASNPPAGKIYVYYDSGNLKARSSSGTITIIAAL